ncbi:ABC transporter permease [Sphaerisporangium corydalis]|uniref:Transport permease protein n=1 Tax=Sphaerisporangium corydalis TaxID=1441875 RepID=A0ABV9E718_9ACTN|nr:ABC transporter permease [Sphaerisporangium corydalis]
MRHDPLHRVAVLTRHNTILRLRDPGHLISYLVMPMALMLVLKPLYGGSMTEGPTQAVTGMLVMFSVLSLSIVGTATLSERTWHTWDRLRATPARPIELLAGKAIPVFVILAVQQAILLAFGSAVVGMPVTGPVLLLAMAVAVWGFALLAIGTAVAALVRSQGELSAVCDVGAMAVSTLGGAFVPVAMMPPWAQAIAPASPGYWAVSMLQAAVRGDVAATLRPAGILAALGVVAGTAACVALSRGWGRSRLL